MDFKDFGEFLEVINRLHQEEREFVICTVIESKGSAPQRVGARMVVADNGESFGTVGGGIVESETITKAKEMLKTRGKPQIHHIELNENGRGLCGGAMSIFLEGFYTKKQIVIFGAGHVAEAVCELLERLNYRITLFDNRKERLDLPVFNRCKKICDEYANIKNYRELFEDCDILVMTPNHEYDFMVIKQILGTGFKSLGLLGSKKKKVELVEFLKREGFGEVEINRVRIPVGIEIGSRSPVEIAISIAAELIKMNSQKK